MAGMGIFPSWLDLSRVQFLRRHSVARMSPQTSILAATLAFIAALAVPLAMATAQDKPSLNRTGPEADRCASLHSYLYRYDIESASQRNTGGRFRADVALALCGRGDYDSGIRILEAELRNSRLPPLPAR